MSSMKQTIRNKNFFFCKKRSILLPICVQEFTAFGNVTKPRLYGSSKYSSLQHKLKAPVFS